MPERNWSPLPGLGVSLLLFSLLFAAQSLTEFSRQLVFSEQRVANAGVIADCRIDELEEEGLSQQECELLLGQLLLGLESTPPWYRSFQLAVSLLAAVVAIACLPQAIALIRNSALRLSALSAALAILLIFDSASFVASLSLGPLMRAQLLWQLALWFFVHLSLLIAVLQCRRLADN